jgi:hypothetical protein
MKFFTMTLLLLGNTYLMAQNVGIGTTTPILSKLEIVASGSQLMTRAGDNLTGLSFSTPLNLSPTIGFNFANVNGGNRYLAAGYGAIIQYSPSSGILYFSTSQTKGNPGDLALFNSNSVAIDSNGFMGIGTTAPKSKLHVNSSMVIGPTSRLPATGYLLSVAGKVICEELKVQLNASWPDYVFDTNYNLPGLNTLEQSVMTEKHLPGIPSAIQIKAEEGIDIGDMQKRLLEKVEELYRYIFEMNNRNNMLEQKILSLEEELKCNH